MLCLDWMLFAAAAVNDTSLQDSMIKQVSAYVGANMEFSGNNPFAIVYSASNASEMAGYARWAPKPLYSMST